MKLFCLSLFLLYSHQIFAQKKPLDHSVYDGWQNIGEKLISHDGKWIVYTINPQEGDNELVIQSPGIQYKRVIARGYNATITADDRFVVFRIKPFFKALREGRIKKKKQNELPKDSLGVIDLATDSMWTQPGINSYTLPEKLGGWIAYQLEKSKDTTTLAGKTDSASTKIIDSLRNVIDSLRMINAALQSRGNKKNTDTQGIEAAGSNLPAKDFRDFAENDSLPGGAETGTDLILKKMPGNIEKIFRNVLYYNFNKTGRKLLVEIARSKKDSLSLNYVLLYDLQKKITDTLSRGGNDFKNFTISDDGAQVAYLAERDSSAKALQKFYRLWYFREGLDSSMMLCDKNSVGMKLGMTIGEKGSLSFSNSGKRLFFGATAIQPPKDTSVADIDKVNLDIWNYKDDYLQTSQLKRLLTDLNKTYLAVYDFSDSSIQQLESEEIPIVYKTNEGDGATFVGITDYGKRVEGQWNGTTLKDIYAINVSTGEMKLVKKDLKGVMQQQWISPTGNYILWYDSKARNYFSYDGTTTRNITSGIKMPLYDVQYDEPDDPPPYGVMAWLEGDRAVFIYDQYAVWSVDPAKARAPVLAIDSRKIKTEYRYVRDDPDEHFVRSGQGLLFRTFNRESKQSGLAAVTLSKAGNSFFYAAPAAYSIGSPVKAKNATSVIYTKENYEESPDIYLASRPLPGQVDQKKNDELNQDAELKLSSLNPQQQQYNWGTAELFKWKAFNGKESAGIIYKPGDFNPHKKYPMICYFYETLSDGLNQYIPPAPTASRLNISFFVSRGYIVFAPDIHYGTGHPGKDAYNYVVSGAKAIVKKGFVDDKKIGIQGQSWGGYQVAYLITATDLFKAAWAGAPVANMTSAYGGIRWETGINRQFQYEKSQSRIGASLWQKPELYIENSPLFHLPKVKTPLVIMSNDADGAVPWYQGIELFTALRRLGKQVWMLSYNGEAHNLVERKNKKDIQIREQQYFDWLLKGEKPPKWITEGVPALKKGKDTGLEIPDNQ